MLVIDALNNVRSTPNCVVFSSQHITQCHLSLSRIVPGPSPQDSADDNNYWWYENLQQITSFELNPRIFTVSNNRPAN